MLRANLQFSTAYAVLLLSLFMLSHHPSCTAMGNDQCATSCGNQTIRYPFRLNTDPHSCGFNNTDDLDYNNYELACEDNGTLILYLNQNRYHVAAIKRRYHVGAINYNNFTIRLVDPLVPKGNCSFPMYSLTEDDISYNSNYSYSFYEMTRRGTLIFIKCENSVQSPLYIDISSCYKGRDDANPSSQLRSYYYVKVGSTSPSDLPDLCRIEGMTLTSLLTDNVSNFSYTDVRNGLIFGFELSWMDACCVNNKGLQRCSSEPFCPNYSNRIYSNFYFDIYLYYSFPFVQIVLDASPEKHGYAALGIFLSLLAYISSIIILHHVLLILIGTPCIIIFLIWKWRRRHLSAYDNIEEFLRRHQDSLIPIRYSYSDIKKITKGFKEKLGEGGYGSVYKGKLRSGRFAAIKMLGKARANGQEFINEVATIGRIHHANVVQLIGYCADGSKRALVYEFMTNGSLDKFTFSEEGCIQVSYEQMHDISVGVARGIEYLHRGCNMQILHFDIKPHNILLDENFNPKISDFGHAKLHSTDNSIVSLTAARGTMGYMAPELFYKNIGGISSKADVYSFGMLLMEMVGRRKNLNAFAAHSSQIYFPTWVYDQLCEGKDVNLGEITAEQSEIARKMIIVALWCIQMKPTDRPSMHKVIEMLEAEVGSLEMPPKPFLVPQESPTNDAEINTSPATVLADPGDGISDSNAISLLASEEQRSDSIN